MEITVAAIRRFPVKAMGGEYVDQVDVDTRGLAGDRWFAVTDSAGRLAAGKETRRFRRLDPVFDFTASGSAGDVLVSGRGGSWKVGDPALDERLSELMGTGVRVLPEGGVMHFDDSPVSLVGTATMQWCRENLGVDGDPRRLRANLLLETGEPFVEETWVGEEIAVGDVVLKMTKQVTRCRVVNLPQDGVAEKQPLLKGLAGRDLKLAVYADVVTPGRIRIGDSVVVR